MFAKILAFVALAAASALGCKTLMTGNNGIKYCVDPCTTGQVRYDNSSGIPVCLTYCNKSKICPSSSIAYNNVTGKPICLTVTPCKACPSSSIRYDNETQEPMCIVSVVNPTKECISQYILYDGPTPKCYDNCKSIRYYNGSPVCLSCLDSLIKYDGTGYPYC